MSVVDWSYGGQHMWDNHKVGTAEADEAINDIDAVWFDPDPASRSNRSWFAVTKAPTTARMVGSPIRQT